MTAGLLLAGSAAAQQTPARWTLAPSLMPQNSGTRASFIAVYVVSRDTVWAAGAQGTFARTTDGGVTWHAAVVPHADSLAFRDVHAINGTTAWLLSIGNGSASRIYHTRDGGATWTLQFTNTDNKAFYDCFSFWDAAHGMAFSDSHDGAFSIVATDNGGVSWNLLPGAALPAAHEGEGGFASSGTCLVTRGSATAWIGTGASAGGARVLRTTDRGRTWTVAETPIVKGSSAGITTLAFRDAQNGMALGGDIGNGASHTDNAAVTRNGGAHWTLAQGPPFAGAVYGSAFVPGAPRPTLVAVGPGGLAVTTNDAATWMPIDTLNHWGVGFAAPDAGFAVGPRGRITHITLFKRTGS